MDPVFCEAPCHLHWDWSVHKSRKPNGERPAERASRPISTYTALPDSGSSPYAPSSSLFCLAVITSARTQCARCEARVCPHRARIRRRTGRLATNAGARSDEAVSHKTPNPRPLTIQRPKGGVPQSEPCSIDCTLANAWSVRKATGPRSERSWGPWMVSIDEAPCRSSME